MTRAAVWGLGGLVVSAFAMGCLGPNETECANGRICPEGTACDEVHTLCVQQSQLDDCAGKDNGAACTVNGTDTVCRDQVCLLQYCGDGIKNAGEQCDGADLGGMNCTMHGFYEPDGLACDDSCRFDTSACKATCGDSIVNGDEDCDGAAPARDACTRLGFDAGRLGCNAHCGPSVDACRTIGWTHEDGPFGSIEALWANSPDDIYAGGQSALFHFDGATWTLVNTGLSQSITGVWGTSTDVFVTGYSGKIAHLVNGAWSVSDVGAYLAAITGSGTEAYAVGSLSGGGGPGVFHSSSGGAWSPVPGFTSSIGYLSSVQAMGPFDLYVVDDKGVQHWDGNTWSRSLTAPVGRLYRAGQELYATAGTAIFHHDSSGWTNAVYPAGYAGPITGTAKDDLFVLGNGTVTHYDGAGWVPIEGSDGGTTNIFALGNGQIIGAGNGVWRYRGDGRIQLPASGASFRAVFAKSTTEIVAVGEAGLIARFKGDRWHLEANPAPTTMFDVWGDFAVGAQGTIIHWNGTSWSAMNNPATAGTYFRSVWGSSATNVYAVGMDGNTPVALRYNGASWSALTIPDLPGPIVPQLVSVWGTASNDVYIVANNPNGDGYIITGGPTTFTTVKLITPSGVNARLNDVWASGPGDVWLVGTGGGVYRGSGTTFAAVPSGTVAELAYVRGASATDIRIVLQGDFGPGDQYIAWNSVTSTFSEKFYLCDKQYMPQRMVLNGLAGVQDNEYVAVGDDMNALRERGVNCRLEIGTDFSQDTVQVKPTSDAPDQIYFTTLMFGGRSELMHFDGNIVTGIDTPFNDPTMVWASSPMDVWAVAAGTHEYAHFDGTSWGTVGAVAFTPAAISGSASNDVWILGQDGSAVRYEGSGWVSHPIPTSSYYAAIWSSGPNLAFAASSYAGTPIQCWNGASWAACPGAVASQDNGLSPAFGGTGPSDVYLAGATNLVSHWDGSTWTNVPFDNPNSSPFTGLAAAAPNDVFAIDYAGAMMHFDGTEWLPVRSSGKVVTYGLVYSNKTFWAITASPKRGLSGLVRATAW